MEVSKSSDITEEDTEESSTKGSSFDYNTDSDIRFESFSYDIAINLVRKAPPSDDVDENDSL